MLYHRGHNIIIWLVIGESDKWKALKRFLFAYSLYVCINMLIDSIA